MGVWGGSPVDVIVKVRPPSTAEVDRLDAGTTLVSFLQPRRDAETIKQLAARGATAISMDLVPRISRAQEMDALSSQATVAGYKAVLLGATHLGRFLPMLTTAAGTIPPAKVLVLGVGVAGLQAIATARRLGARVSAFDVRPAVREQVESLGATFIAAEAMTQEAEAATGYATALGDEAHRRELEAIGRHVGEMDLVISTALIPNQPAPLLLTKEMVRDMRPGSVIVDLAAEAGGNCALTSPGQMVEADGVTIIGPLNLASTVPQHASQMYSRNVLRLLQHLLKGGKLRIDLSDEITGAMVATHQGETRVSL
jgi:NAD(P) transhydrogenase subunit alpha